MALVSGPTTAMTNSCIAERDSWLICETPPSTNRVMLETCSPYSRAATECASSCSSREVKKTTAPSTPRLQATTASGGGLTRSGSMLAPSR